MKGINSKLSVLAFVVVTLVSTTVIFNLPAISQEKQKSGNDTSISWSPKKHRIQSNDKNLVLNLPDSFLTKDIVVGVIPVRDGDSESLIIGLVTWKDSKMGSQTLIDSVVNLSDESIVLMNERINLNKLDELNSNNGKSLLVLLNVKQGTKISLLKNGEQYLSKTISKDGEILKQPEQLGIESMGLKKMTGASSLLGELQTRRLIKGIRKNSEGGLNK
ncbi:MAG: hypothetical protein M3405_07040 [Acidobacteriota bacterium]|jgi:hypothetical protein|nr:hypothetical protein [Acidobacteriota bacterium]